MSADVAAENADFDQLGAGDLDSTPELGVFEAPNEYAVQSYEEIGINDYGRPGTYGADAAPANHLFLCSGDKLTAVRYRCFLGVFCSPIAWADFPGQ